MRKLLVWAIPAFGAAVLGKIVDHYFPTVFPAALVLASRPVPAWTLVLALGAAIVCGYKLWNATNPDRIRKRVLRAMGKGEYHVLTEHEEHVLQELYSSPTSVPTAAVRQNLRRATRVSDVQIEIAIGQLVDADWVAREYVGIDRREHLKMTAIAYRHAEKQGYGKT